jgi:hypothetical protein
MIVVRRPYPNSPMSTESIIWLDNALPSDFAKRLLNELLGIASPIGLGAIEASARKHEPLDTLIEGAVFQAGSDSRGQRNWDHSYNFDYVAGYRIKVVYYEKGFPDYGEVDGSDAMYSKHPGTPMITSIAFDNMYGEGALENAVTLATFN